MRMPEASWDAARIAPVLAGAAALVCVLIGGWWFGRLHDMQQVQNLEVAGPMNHVSANAVALAVGDRVDNGFLALDLEGVKRDVEQLPWVARARAERFWPAGVRIQVWERAASARWGAHQLLDVQAQAFTPPAADLLPELPMLDGPAGHEREVLDTYRRDGARLASTQFALAGLALDARGEWSATTQRGIGLRLGRGTPEQKFEMLATTVSKALADRLDQVAYVDLRYTNGFAVGWKEQTQSSAGTTHG